MKTMGKRATSWVLVLVMCLGFLQLPAFAAEGGAGTIEIPLWTAGEDGESTRTTYDFGAEVADLENGTWTSSNPEVLSVDENGVGTALKTGKATVTLTIVREVEAPENPEEPINPADPADPENPADPVDPADPEEPTDPVDPVDPEGPTDPVDPVDPEEPTDPVDPVDPEGPTDSVDPVDPEGPTDPVDPADPEEPTAPVDPADPEGPTDPVGPTEPERPTEPAGPDTSSTPDAPDAPEPPDASEAPDDEPSSTFLSDQSEDGSTFTYTWNVVVYDRLEEFVAAANAMIAELETRTFTSEEELNAAMEAYNTRVMELLDTLSEAEQATEEFLSAYNALIEAFGLASVTLADVRPIFDGKEMKPDKNGVYTVNSGGNLVIPDGGTVRGRFVINTSGTVNISGKGTIDGGAVFDETTGIASTRTGSVIHIKGGATVNLRDVTVTGGSGTTIETGSKYNSNGSYNKWYEAYYAGGGVYLEHGTLNMSSGMIDGNTANKGGGIYVHDNQAGAPGGTLNMSGGTVSNNFTAQGGETWVNPANPNAISYRAGEGGGIWIGSKRSDPKGDARNVITGGVIENNHCNTATDWGGGGVYVNSYADLRITLVEINGNSADGFGGGVSGCPHANIGMTLMDGAIIYGNEAKGIWPFGETSSLWDMKDGTGDYVAAGDKGFTKELAMDFYCVDSSAVQGQPEGWKGRASYPSGNVSAGYEVTIPEGKWFVLGRGSLGLTAAGTPKFKDQTPRVTISGNSSKTHGGGVACNGALFLGTLTPGEESNNAWSIEVNKQLLGVKKESQALDNMAFKFQLLNADTKVPVAESTNDNNGVIRFIVDSNNYAGSESGTLYNFIVKEVKGDNDNITYDETEHPIQVRVTRRTDKFIIGAFPSSKEQQWKDTGKYIITHTSSAELVSPKDGVTIKNYVKEGSLSISKSLVNSSLAKAGEQFTFDIEIKGLPNGTYSGITFTNGKGTVTLTYTEDGQQMVKTIKGLPAGAAFTVTERDVENYTTASQKVQSGTIGPDGPEGVVTTPVVKFVNERDTANLVVKKVVNRNETTSKPAPKDDTFEITVTLGNGSGEKTEVKSADNTAAYVENGVYVFTLKDNGTSGETGTITGIPTKTAYKVEETKINGTDYENTNKDILAAGGTVVKDLPIVNVNNHYFNVKTTDVTVEKEWKGGDNFKPDFITVQLYRDGELCENTPSLILNEKNGWTNGWKDLPMYAEESSTEAYAYTAREVSVTYPTEVPEGKTVYTADKRDGNIIRVRSGVEAADGSGNEIVGGWIVSDSNSVDTEGKITLTNQWRGKEDLGDAFFSVLKVDSETKDPIEGVTFELTKKDETVPEGEEKFLDTQTTDADGKVSFEGLKEGTYILTETKVPDGYDANGNVGRTWEIVFERESAEKVRLESVKEIGLVDENGNDNTILGENTWTWNPVGNGEVEIKNGEITIENQVIKGSLQLTKVMELDGTTVRHTDFRGYSFTFDLYEGRLNTQEAIDAATPTGEPLELKGYGSGATSKTIEDLRYGWYTLVERTPEDHKDAYTWKGVRYLANEDRDGLTNIAEGNFAVITDADKNVIAYQVKVVGQDETYGITATNMYTRGLGELKITKTLSGNNTETNKLWAFTVALESPQDYVTLAGSYSVTYSDGRTGTASRTSGGRYTGIAMAGGVTATLHGLPIGVSYRVTEDEANLNDYATTAQKNGAPSRSLSVTGTVEADETDDIVFDNYRNRTPDGPTPGRPGTPPGTPTTPTPETPDVFVPETPTPLANVPEEFVEVPAEDVPLANLPEEEELEIPEEDVPLDEAPATGDESRRGLWLSLALSSGMAMLWLALGGRKKEEEQ